MKPFLKACDKQPRHCINECKVTKRSFNTPKYIISVLLHESHEEYCTFIQCVFVAYVIAFIQLYNTLENKFIKFFYELRRRKFLPIFSQFNLFFFKRFWTQFAINESNKGSWEWKRGRKRLWIKAIRPHFKFKNVLRQILHLKIRMITYPSPRIPLWEIQRVTREDKKYIQK